MRGFKAVIVRLKLSYELQLPDMPDIQVRPPWYSVPVEVRVTELMSNSGVLCGGVVRVSGFFLKSDS